MLLPPSLPPFWVEATLKFNTWEISHLWFPLKVLKSQPPKQETKPQLKERSGIDKGPQECCHLSECVLSKILSLLSQQEKGEGAESLVPPNASGRRVWSSETTPAALEKGAPEAKENSGGGIHMHSTLPPGL